MQENKNNPSKTKPKPNLANKRKSQENTYKQNKANNEADAACALL